MGLAHEFHPIRLPVSAHAVARIRSVLAAVVWDGLLVVGTVAVFSAVAIGRHGWAALTDSGRTLQPLLEFSAVYLFAAFAAATLWMGARAAFGYRNTLNKSWCQGFVASIMLLCAAIALVPPIWD